MARTVLTSGSQWVASLLLAAALLFTPVSCADQTACSSKDLDPEIHGLQEQMSKGAFYKELLLRFGKPLTCNVDVQDGKMSLTYVFRLGAQLIAKTDPKVEFSEQTVKLIHLETGKAIALLKRTERDAYHPNGCGISWTRGEDKSTASSSDSREVVYRGETCNCQARLVYKGRYVVTLVLRSAC
jgi:hypothetical protein